MNEARLQFLDAVLNAEKRLWILDKKLDGNAFGLLWGTLEDTGVYDIKSVTERHQASTIHSWISAHRKPGMTVERDKIRWTTPRTAEGARTPRHPGQPHEIRIYIDIHLGMPKVHDRFALVDDELWHFGGTVGAVDNQGLSAVSRGWFSEGERFATLFNQGISR
jgi:hypothetical protein